jgi:putative transposase
MFDRADGTLSIRRQCALVGVARSSIYRPRRPANDNDVVPMRLTDELSRPGRFSVRAAWTCSG